TAFGINNAGQVVGSGPGSDWQYPQAYIRSSGGQMNSLGTLEGGVGPSQANDINSAGQAVGWTVTYASPSRPHPFLWTPDQGMIELGELAGSEQGEANAINDRGDVVGYVGFHGFLYSQGVMT